MTHIEGIREQGVEKIVWASGRDERRPENSDEVRRIYTSRQKLELSSQGG